MISCELGIDHTGQQRMEQIIPRLAQAENADEKLKAKNQMVRADLMTGIRQRAEENVLAELFYGQQQSRFFGGGFC